jgi:hypothetical protein
VTLANKIIEDKDYDAWKCNDSMAIFIWTSHKDEIHIACTVV